jgi:hypothetical protein
MTPTQGKISPGANLVEVRGLTLAALAIAGVLVLSNSVSMRGEWHSYLSSLPLALAGLGYGVLQLRLKPPRPILLKRLLLAATFVTWAIDQLLPPGKLATFIGDLVIAAYVLDLFWLIQEQVAVSASSDSGDRFS